jgi:hypothetical protein
VPAARGTSGASPLCAVSAPGCKDVSGKLLVNAEQADEGPKKLFEFREENVAK